MPVGPSARFAPRPFLRCFPGRKKPPLREQRRPVLASARNLLLERGIDRVEVAAQLAAEAIHGRDNRQRDTGRDQAVLNGGCAGFIGHELCENVLQAYLLLGCVNCHRNLGLMI